MWFFISRPFRRRRVIGLQRKKIKTNCKNVFFPSSDTTRRYRVAIGVVGSKYDSAKVPLGTLLLGIRRFRIRITLCLVFSPSENSGTTADSKTVKTKRGEHIKPLMGGRLVETFSRAFNAIRLNAYQHARPGHCDLHVLRVHKTNGWISKYIV